MLPLLKHLACMPTKYALLWVHLLAHDDGSRIDMASIRTSTGLSRSDIHRYMKAGLEKLPECGLQVIVIRESEHSPYVTINHNIGGSQSTVVPSKKASKPKTDSDVAVLNEDDLFVRDIVDYLNSTTGSDYKYHTKSTVSAILALKKQKYTAEDIKAVIAIKTFKWKNTDQEIYLRPMTLFGGKFESYLQEAKKHVTNAPDRKQAQLIRTAQGAIDADW